MTRIVVVGSANMDLVVRTPVLPRPGETVLGDSFATTPGGKGANQAIAVARAGAECAFIGAVGRDAFGETLRANLSGALVDTRGLRAVSGPSGVALIAVDSQAENFIVVAPGANGTLTTLAAADRLAIETADVLLCQLEIPVPTVAQAVAVARSAGTKVILNAAPARPLPAELLAAVDLLVVNETEAATVTSRSIAGSVASRNVAGSGTGRESDRRSPDSLPGVDGDVPGVVRELLDALTVLVPRVVLTLGAEGAAYADRLGARIVVSAPRVDAVDTTGAGDGFAGALAVAWARQRPIVDALRWACAAGALCATRHGASPPTAAEIDELFGASA